MAEQLKLPFYEVEISCPVQEKYQAIAPILAGQKTPQQQAETLNLGYSTIMKWLKEFREKGMEGLFDKSRKPNTPERIIVTLLYLKCIAPKASDFEIAKVCTNTTGHKIHNETVKVLLERYFFWRYEDFRRLIQYPIPEQAQKKRLEIFKLSNQGWSEKTIAYLLKCSRAAVSKWIHRGKFQIKENLNQEPSLFELSRRPKNPERKVYFGTINTILQLQRKYGPSCGSFRIQGYLKIDYGINLGQTTIKKIMSLNRRLHLAPQREVKILEKEIREGPLKSQRPFEHTFIDIRYLDAKPEGVQLYSCLLLEGLSRTILAGSLTRKQDLGVVLRLYYLAALEWGLWNVVVSDHGSQFTSHLFTRVNKRLGIYHHLYDKGHPWQSLIESNFGIQARMGEYIWQQCSRVDQAIEVHRELIRDHNRLPHFAHCKREDQKLSPLQVLSSARGRETDSATLHRAFSRRFWNRKTDNQGFVRVNRWKIYIEEGLPKTPVQVTYWDGKLRAEYQNHLLAEYNCKWNSNFNRPKSIANPTFFDTPFQSTQLELFDIGINHNPVELIPFHLTSKKVAVGAEQLKLYFGPELLK